MRIGLYFMTHRRYLDQLSSIYAIQEWLATLSSGDDARQSPFPSRSATGRTISALHVAAEPQCSCRILDPIAYESC